MGAAPLTLTLFREGSRNRLSVLRDVLTCRRGTHATHIAIGSVALAVPAVKSPRQEAHSSRPAARLSQWWGPAHPAAHCANASIRVGVRSVEERLKATHRSVSQLWRQRAGQMAVKKGIFFFKAEKS